MIKRFLRTVSALMIAGVLILPASPAYAQSSSGGSNDTLDGLWKAYCLLFCSSTTKPKPAQPTTGNPTPSPSPTPNPAPISTSGAYVALGDSVAAGVGLPTASQVPSRETRCGRTAEAYPHQVARSTGLPLVHLACSGADVDELFTPDVLGGANLPAQIPTAFANGKPRLISITAGANDMEWSQVLRTCYSSNCATQFWADNISDDLRDVQEDLITALRDIRQRGGNNPPTVIITGYYNPVSAACTQLTTRVTNNEVIFMDAAVKALNQTLRQTAAAFPNARFAEVNFTGHDVCSSDPWVQGLAASRPFHPTATGQRVMAQAVVRAYNR